MRGPGRWAPRGSARPPTCRCSRTTTWSSGCSRSPGSRARTPSSTSRRLEMTRFSLGELQQETGVGVVDVSNRMVDFGVDAPWLSPRALDRPGADHAGGRRDVVEGGHRLLDRRARRRSAARPARIPSSSGRHLTTRSSTSSPTSRSTTPTSGRRPGGPTGARARVAAAAERVGAMTDLAGRAARSSASAKEVIPLVEAAAPA